VEELCLPLKLEEEERMPIYEYLCQDCGQSFEAIVASSTSEVSCRHCQSPKLEKKFSTFAVAGPSDGGQSMEAPACGPCGCGAPRPGMCQLN
jgi:putative FmdB family regulatory protein